MKRARRLRGLWRSFPLIFWQPCEKCEMEFRRELGWTLTVGASCSIYRHVCASCAPERKDAENFFLPGGLDSDSFRPPPSSE